MSWKEDQARGMPRNPRVVSLQARKIAALLDREIGVHCGPEATFEQREEMAATTMREALALLAGNGKGTPEGAV